MRVNVNLVYQLPFENEGSYFTFRTPVKGKMTFVVILIPILDTIFVSLLFSHPPFAIRRSE